MRQLSIILLAIFAMGASCGPSPAPDGPTNASVTEMVAYQDSKTSELVVLDSNGKEVVREPKAQILNDGDVRNDLLIYLMEQKHVVFNRLLNKRVLELEISGLIIRLSNTLIAIRHETTGLSVYNAEGTLVFGPVKVSSFEVTDDLLAYIDAEQKLTVRNAKNLKGEPVVSGFPLSGAQWHIEGSMTTIFSPSGGVYNAQGQKIVLPLITDKDKVFGNGKLMVVTKPLANSLNSVIFYDITGKELRVVEGVKLETGSVELNGTLFSYKKGDQTTVENVLSGTTLLPPTKVEKNPLGISKNLVPYVTLDPQSKTPMLTVINAQKQQVFAPRAILDLQKGGAYKVSNRLINYRDVDGKEIVVNDDGKVVLDAKDDGQSVLLSTP
jgi:hypothetical protein